MIMKMAKRTGLIYWAEIITVSSTVLLFQDIFLLFLYSSWQIRCIFSGCPSFLGYFFFLDSRSPLAAVTIFSEYKTVKTSNSRFMLSSFLICLDKNCLWKIWKCLRSHFLPLPSSSAQILNKEGSKRTDQKVAPMHNSSSRCILL